MEANGTASADIDKFLAWRMMGKQMCFRESKPLERNETEKKKTKRDDGYFPLKKSMGFGFGIIYLYLVLMVYEMLMK